MTSARRCIVGGLLALAIAAPGWTASAAAAPKKPFNNGLTGKVYHSFGGKLYVVALRSGTRKVVTNDRGRGSFDVSRDGSVLVRITDDSFLDQTVEVRFTNPVTGAALGDVRLNDDFAWHEPRLSPDASKVAVFTWPITKGAWVFDRAGNELANYASDDADPLFGVSWTSDGRLLLEYRSGLRRTDPDLQNATILTQMPFGKYSDTTMSPDGRRIAFTADNHVWIMNADGSDKRQVTTSDRIEEEPAWSPSGGRLAIAVDRFVTTVGRSPLGTPLVGDSISNLATIPATGKRFDLRRRNPLTRLVERRGGRPYDRLVPTGGRAVWVR